MGKDTRKEKSTRSRAKKQERNYTLKPVATKLESGEPTSLPTPAELSIERKPKDDSVVTTVNPIPTQTQVEEVQTPVVTPASPTPPDTSEKPKSFAEILAERYADMRKTAEQEKTDAGKMQKYYALTDALRAIGQLGGTAVGGAIGGDIADSAPAVDPYKESRGYLEAFENAKKASDRLKALDEKGFQLALRDEERAYNASVKEAENAYKEKLDAADKAWQMKFYDYKAEKEKAIAEGNIRLKAELDAKEDAAQQEYLKERMAIQQQYEKELKALSERIVRIQMGEDVDGTGKNLGKTIPFTFHNGNKMDIPQSLYPEMLKFFASKGKIGEEVVDEENIESVLRNHPDMVNSFLRIYGLGKTEDSPSVQTVPPASVQTEEDTEVDSWNTARETARAYRQAKKDAKKATSNVESITPEDQIAVMNELPIGQNWRKPLRNEGTPSAVTTTEAESKWANKKTGRKS